MNKGDYVRILTLSGISKIAKLEKIDDICITDKGAVDKNNIIKSSPNIIDLIEVGDFINKQCIIEIKDKTFYTSGGYFLAFEDFDDIVETIVTHQQFSSMEYKVESEVK